MIDSPTRAWSIQIYFSCLTKAFATRCISWRGFCVVCGLLLGLVLLPGQQANAQVIEPSITPAVEPTVPLASNILAKVVSALKHTDYRGTITYEQNGKLEVMEVSHAVIDGVEFEKIYFLNGDDRELAKRGKKVVCQSAGDKLLSGMPINLPTGDFAALEKSYRIAVIGEDRVAGRSAWVIQMLPTDEFRHGLIFTVDKQTFIPLKTMYVSSNRKVLERFHFVALDTDPKFEINEFDGSTQYADDRCDSAAKTENTRASKKDSPWKPAWVPSGFVLSSYSYTEEDGHIETYTDGLASFTIIIKPLESPGQFGQEAGQEVPLQDSSPASFSTNLRKGATIIILRQYGTAQMPVQASLLGEIPSNVAIRILSSVKFPTE